jgi:hypothetical protein
MDSMNSDDKSASSASGDELPSRLHTLLKKLDRELPEQKDQKPLPAALVR